jgi:hypothetical protein
MLRILLYVCIILAGFQISKSSLLSEGFYKKIGKFQSMALFFLLGVMGYKVGADDTLIHNLYRIGIEAFTVSSLTIVFSVFFTYLVFRGRK